MTLFDIPMSPRLRREWIKYQLHLAGYSLAELAREIGVSRRATAQALRVPYPKMERIIAGKLGLRPEQLWPERYLPDGRTNRPMGRPRGHVNRVNQTSQAGNGKDTEAA